MGDLLAMQRELADVWARYCDGPWPSLIKDDSPIFELLLFWLIIPPIESVGR